VQTLLEAAESTERGAVSTPSTGTGIIQRYVGRCTTYSTVIMLGVLYSGTLDAAQRTALY
jgi:hypothetical protein